MRIAIGAACLSLVALTACGEPTSPKHDPGADMTQDDVVYVADSAFVLDTGKKVALCLGGVMDSLPPQCDGPSITNWSWDDAAEEESASDVTWGSYQITGTYDGETFTLTKPPRSPVVSDGDDTDFTAPCDEPEGGWVADDPSMSSDGARTETMRIAQREPDYADGWIDYIEEPSDDIDVLEGNVILVMAFTGDLDRHETVARETWGGPLCLVQHERTIKELKVVQGELSDIVPDMLWSGIDVVENKVDLGVVLATPEMLAEIEARYGPGTVQVQAALRAVE